jgi:predicted metalloprotease with PDZ domain
VLVSDDGTVLDSTPGMAAFAAGIVPGMRIVQVNGARFSGGGLEQAVQSSLTGKLELTTANGAFRSTVVLDYHKGARYPKLERNGSTSDMLSQILSARAGH